MSSDVYRERAALVAYLASQYPSVIAYNDPAEPDWPVVYITTGKGQLSWHLAERDLDLFPLIPIVPPDAVVWDGHDTSEKYERLAVLVFETVVDRAFPCELRSQKRYRKWALPRIEAAEQSGDLNEAKQVRDLLELGDLVIERTGPRPHCGWSDCTAHQAEGPE